MSVKTLFPCFVLALFSLPANAAVGVHVTCVLSDESQSLIELTHTKKEVTGRDLLNVTTGDGKPVHSTVSILNVVPGADSYEYDVHMVEHMKLGELSDDPTRDRSDPCTNDMRFELKVNLTNPSYSTVHMVTRNTFMGETRTDESKEAISCSIVSLEQ